MVEKRKRGRPPKKDQWLIDMHAKAADYQAKEQLKKNSKDKALAAAAAKFHVSNAKEKAKATKEFELSLEKARNKAREELDQKREGAVNLRYVAERLRDIKNMDEVEAFYKECVYNIGINTLRNGEADG